MVRGTPRSFVRQYFGDAATLVASLAIALVLLTTGPAQALDKQGAAHKGGGAAGQRYLDVRARYVSSLGRAPTGLNGQLGGGDLAEWVTLGWFAWDRTNAVRPAELDLTVGFATAFGPWGAMVAYERDMPVDGLGSGLVQHMVMTQASWSFACHRTPPSSGNVANGEQPH